LWLATFLLLTLLIETYRYGILIIVLFLRAVLSNHQRLVKPMTVRPIYDMT